MPLLCVGIGSLPSCQGRISAVEVKYRSCPSIESVDGNKNSSLTSQANQERGGGDYRLVVHLARPNNDIYFALVAFMILIRRIIQIVTDDLSRKRDMVEWKTFRVSSQVRTEPEY